MVYFHVRTVSMYGYGHQRVSVFFVSFRVLVYLVLLESIGYGRVQSPSYFFYSYLKCIHHFLSVLS